MSETRIINFRTDVDGVFAQAPIPFETLVRLLLRTVQVPTKLNIPAGYPRFYMVPPGEKGRHKGRKLKRDAAAGYRNFKDVADANGFQLQAGIISGRDEGQKDLVAGLVQEARLENLFNCGITLNKGLPSVKHKLLTTSQLSKDTPLVFVEDDLRAALAVASLGLSNHNVLVYLIQNASNVQALLWWAGISGKMPANIVKTKSVLTASQDFEQRLSSRAFPSRRK